MSGLPCLEIYRIAGLVPAGDHRERGSLEFTLETRDQLLEKSATKGPIVFQPPARRAGHSQAAEDGAYRQGADRGA